jgi:hypothetical protein
MKSRRFTAQYLPCFPNERNSTPRYCCAAGFHPGLGPVLGQTLLSRDLCGTAALPLKPDIGWRGWHGRKVP